MKRTAAWLAGSLTLAGASPAHAAINDDTDITRAAAFCEADEFVEDDGHGIVFDGVMDTDSAGLLAAVCVMNLLLPDWFIDVVSSTTSLWGLVRNEIGDYLVLNSYHPDNGMFVVIVEVDYTHDVEIPEPIPTTELVDPRTNYSRVI